MSYLGLSHEFELRQPACREFKWKVQQAMQSSKQHPMLGETQINKFFFGFSEE